MNHVNFLHYVRDENAIAAIHWNHNEYPFLHDHDHWEFTIITNSVCRNNINGKDYIMKKGDAVLIKPADCHYLVNAEKNGPTIEHINFIMRNSMVKSYCDEIGPDFFKKLSESPVTVYSLSSEQYNKVILYTTTLLSQKYNNEDNALAAKFFMSFLIEIVAEKFFLESSNYPQWIYSILKDINSPSYLDAFPRTILEKYPYSHTYVSRMFKSCTGQTLIEYMNNVKMTKSCELLMQTDLNTLQIANMLGYNSLSHFNHIFKKTYGVSPRQYVKKYSHRQQDPSE